MYYILVDGELKPLAKEMHVPRRVASTNGGKPTTAKVASLYLVEKGTRVNTKVEAAYHDSVIILHGSTLKRVAMYEASVAEASFIIWDQATNDKILILWIDKLPDPDQITLSE